MKPNKIELRCSMCGSHIADSTDMNKTTQQLAEEHDVAFFHLKNADVARISNKPVSNTISGYICRSCSAVLSDDSHIKKITKIATEIGNSSHIILPKKWEGQLIIAYRIGGDCEMCRKRIAVDVVEGKNVCAQCLIK